MTFLYKADVTKLLRTVWRAVSTFQNRTADMKNGIAIKVNPIAVYDSSTGLSEHV